MPDAAAGGSSRMKILSLTHEYLPVGGSGGRGGAAIKEGMGEDNA